MYKDQLLYEERLDSREFIYSAHELGNPNSKSQSTILIAVEHCSRIYSGGLKLTKQHLLEEIPYHDVATLTKITNVAHLSDEWPAFNNDRFNILGSQLPSFLLQIKFTCSRCRRGISGPPFVYTVLSAEFLVWRKRPHLLLKFSNRQIC